MQKVVSEESENFCFNGLLVELTGGEHPLKSKRFESFKEADFDQREKKKNHLSTMSAAQLSTWQFSEHAAGDDRAAGRPRALLHHHPPPGPDPRDVPSKQPGSRTHPATAEGAARVSVVQGARHEEGDARQQDGHLQRRISGRVSSDNCILYTLGTGLNG
ncbi:hypothetical protein CEXT_811051 [Caerostris extrusa]|uniref:Uncharacterized protein n=1 Tax=Caerostris extrusa TaxID=172846 RepID=A0AAV4TB88_CAEEX|nr:hypothetical protein CEXT_811051 [Caerostris extrusa]